MNIIKSDILSEIDFIEHGFFDRRGGESTGEFSSLNVGLGRGDDDQKVLRNRAHVAEHFGIQLANMIMLKQVHGDTVHVISKDNASKYEFKTVKQSMANEGDAIVTQQSGILIGVGTADCAPILLCDPSAKYIGVIHAGWRGAVGTVIEKTMQQMKDLGCKNIVAAIGPCMQKRYFEVKSEVLELVDKKYISPFGGKMFFDMQLLVLEKLMKNGAKAVSKLNVDTMGNDNYFSYRRQAGKAGVQFSGIMMKGSEHD
ncbi:MAG: peptidoglycan editing factor PgeF [Holosporales bacterium]|jgi:YfiH family protein|nr:peptidoglycan editing factor PgeF [Holosporales bacterium]